MCRFIGGLYGRVIGRLLVDAHGGIPTDIFWHWIDPGAMALIGAASFFAGVSRLTMSLTVIMVILAVCNKTVLIRRIPAAVAATNYIYRVLGR
jgi:H+/Cl- antiporter ClcA